MFAKFWSPCIPGPDKLLNHYIILLYIDIIIIKIHLIKKTATFPSNYDIWFSRNYFKYHKKRKLFAILFTYVNSQITTCGSLRTVYAQCVSSWKFNVFSPQFYQCKNVKSSWRTLYIPTVHASMDTVRSRKYRIRS